MNVLFEQSLDRKDEWLTPPNIIESLGIFDLDPCSPINRPWPTALNHFTEKDNGLTKKWNGRVWCNPPYSDIESWLKKCTYHNNCIALTFARTDTRYFFNYVWNKADSLFFFSGRIAFYHVTGIKGKSAGAPSVLIAYGENNSDFIAQSGLKGKHILLKNTPPHIYNYFTMKLRAYLIIIPMAIWCMLLICKDIIFLSKSEFKSKYS